MDGISLSVGPKLSGNAFDQTEFRRVLGQFVAGVTIVTTLDRNSRLCGFTANSFSAVSLEPPLVLVCVNYRARSYEHLRDQQAFTIHILDGDQEEVATAFALPGRDRSNACDWHVNERGFPILSRFHAALECRLFREYEGGDHAIIVGKVEHLYTKADGGVPLLSYNGRLFSLNGGGERQHNCSRRS